MIRCFRRSKVEKENYLNTTAQKQATSIVFRVNFLSYIFQKVQI